MSDKELKEKLKQAKKENEDKVNLKKEQDLVWDFEKLQSTNQI